MSDVSIPVVNHTLRVLCQPRLQHDEALIGLAAALDGADPHELRQRLDDVARPSFGLASAGLHEQAAGIAQTLTDRLSLSAAVGDEGHVLITRALAHRTGHPMLLAALGHEIARRAGLSSVVAWSVTGFWTVLVRDDTLLPIGFADAPRSAEELRGCCAHQVAHWTLARIVGSGSGERSRRAELMLGALAPGCRGELPRGDAP